MPEVIVFTGADRDYESFLKEEIDPDERTIEYLELIRIYNSKVRDTWDYAGKDLTLEDDFDNVVVRSADFGSVLSHVISNFATIATQGCHFERIYVQNPPKQSMRSLESAFPKSIRREGTTYPCVSKQTIASVSKSLQSDIMGQEVGKFEIVVSLYQLSSMRQEKPAVLLFYGPSGVGKTETAKCLSNALGGKLTRVQFSMLQNNEAYDYVFGAEHSKGSLARDLLGRESNVILFDEFDKVHHGLYNAFYELFDEGIFEDSYYRVDMKDALFVLTSNFSSEEEMRETLGPAMFSRISACIEYEDLDVRQKEELVKRHYGEIVCCLDDEDRETINGTDVLPWFIEHAAQYDNMRIMNTKMERAVFGILSTKLIGSTEGAPSVDD